MKTSSSSARSSSAKINRKPSAKIIPLHAFQQPQQKQTAQLIDAVWAAISTSLWFNTAFTEEEISGHKAQIAEYFFNGKNARLNFSELIQRLCLAKRHVAHHGGNDISKPQEYLSIHNPSGFAGTAACLEQVKHSRKEVPDYYKGMATLAKTLLAFIENPCEAEFKKGRRQLMKQRAFDLLHIYNHTILHFQNNL